MDTLFVIDGNVITHSRWWQRMERITLEASAADHAHVALLSTIREAGVFRHYVQSMLGSSRSRTDQS